MKKLKARFEMKVKYFMPLVLALAAIIIPSALMIPKNISMILQFLGFLFFFSMSYFYGIRMTIKNRDAVLKIGKISPYIFPILFFSIPTIIMTILSIPGKSEMIIIFSGCFLFCIVVYFVGIKILIRDMRRNLKSEIDSYTARMSFSSSNKKRLLLINPVNQNISGLTINNSSKFPPLGLGILAALTTDDFEIELIDENYDTFEYKEADLVGITAFTSAANRAYELASQYTKRNIPVVMGGIHASMIPDEALCYVDGVVIGEAESVWPLVLKDFQNQTLKKVYRGDHQDLEDMIVPDRRIFSPRYQFATIQTSRGCPMDCSFCSVTAFNGKKYRQRPVEDVLDELETIPQNYLFFIDDNLLGYGKQAEERAIKLFKGMVERKLNKVWHCQSSLNFGSNEEVLKWAAKSGCKLVFIGLESADPEELKDMNKKVNLRFEYQRVFKNIHKHGIAVLGAFIYGSDIETKASMLRKTEYILKNRIDVIDTTILTPLPGTRLYKEFEKQERLYFTNFPKDWDKYSMTELTYRLKRMSNEEFKETLDTCTKRLRSLRTLYKKFIKTLIYTRSLETAMWAYSSNTVFRNVSRSNYHARLM